MIPQFVLSLIFFSIHPCGLAGLFSIGSEYPGRRGIEYEYDAPNRISEVYEAPSGGQRSLFAKYFYHGPGLRVARRDMIGNASEADPAVRLSVTYDAAGRPLETFFTQRPASGANGLLELSFGWDAAWSQSRRQAAWAFGSAADLLERERTFTHEAADRLTGGALRAPAAGAPAGSGTPVAFSRALDAAGNRGGDFVVGAFNKYLRPQATPSVDFIYDSNGNLTNEETAHESGGAGDGHDYYNWRNQLALHYHGAAQQFHRRYDALGRLISKRYSANADSRWAWDGWRAVEEKRQAGNSSWVTEATWVYGNGLDETLSMRRDALDASGAPAAAGEGDGAAEDYFLLADAQNTVWGLANASGALVERYEYSPEGEPSIFTMAPGAAAIGYGGGAVSGPGAGLPNTPAAVSPYRNARLFTGRDYDADTGLYYHRLRWYSPALGRFVSRDPLGAWGDPSALGNAYTYSANSPWTYNDPLGLWSLFGDEPRLGQRTLDLMAEGSVQPWDPSKANTVDLTQRASDYTMASAKAAGEVTNAAAGMLVEPVGMAQDAADAVQSAKEGDWLGLGLAAGSFIAPGRVPKEAREDACKAARNTANRGKVRNPYGTKGKPDHQAKVAELEKKAIDEMLPGEKMLREHGLQGDQPIKRRPDVQIIDPSGKTRKVFEAERNPESKRHRERIEAYEKNDIEHETHPLE